MAFVLLALTLGLSAQTTSQVTTAATNGLSFAVTDALNFTNSQGCIACHRQGGVVYGAAQGVATGLPLSTTTLNQLDQLATRLAGDQVSGGSYDGAWLHAGCCYPWSKGGWAGFGLANYDQNVKPLYGSNLQRNLDYNLRVLGNNYTHFFPSDGRPFANLTRRYVPQDHNGYPTTASWVWQIPTAQTIVVINAALQHPDIAAAEGTTYRQYMSDLADGLEGFFWRSNNGYYNDELLWEMIGSASAGRTVQGGDTTGTPLAMQNDLLSRQNSDGGWGEGLGGASDPYHTGLALYALHLEGLRLDQSPAVQQAVNWLLAHQNPDGTWFYYGNTYPYSHASDLPTTFAAIGLAAYGPSNFALTLAPTSATVTPNVGTTQTVTFHATVNNSGYVSGTYAITLSGGLPGTTLAASPASLSLSPAQTGTSTITVVLPAQLPQGAIMPITVTAAGTTVNGTASKSQTFTIGAGALPGPNAVPTTTVWTSAPSTAQSGTPVTLSAVVRDSGGGAVTAGTLTFYVGTRAVAATLANGSGVYQTQWIVDGSFGVGAEPLIAAYNGYASGGTGTDYKPSSANASINITKPAASAALGNLNQSYDGTPKSVTVTTTPAGLATSVTYNGAATLPIAAGSYAVQATITDNNYVSQPANGTLTIAKATPQVSAPTNLSISYGTPSTVIAGRVGLATVAATGTVTVVLNGVSQNASLAADGTYSAAFNTGRLGVATYPVNILYNGDSNFAVGTGAASLTVTAIPLSVQVASATHVYGAANPVFTGTISGLVNGDVVTATYSSAATSNVGSYPITVALSGSALSNYVPTISNGTLTITPAPLTVTVASATHVYGAANPAFTGTLTGLVNGDVLTATYSSAATVTSGVGTYPITAALSGSALGNYTPAITNGTLTVTPAPLGVTIQNATRLYGAANPTFTAVYSGVLNGDVLNFSGITAAGATTD
ncbi:MAG: MBG domain-containing protein, partial [Terriglobales bacterium]